MKFDYNGNLEENKRIEQVSNEIMEYYPEITSGNAMLIALIEEPITTEVNNIIYFKRLFNILYIIHQDKTIFDKVYKDLLDIYNSYKKDGCIEDDKIDSMMNQVNNYANGKRMDFPSISEFY